MMSERVKLWSGNIIFAEMYAESLQQNDIPVAVLSEGIGIGYLGGTSEATLWLLDPSALDDPEKHRLIREVIPPEEILLEPPLA